jgi:Na+-translocating ferredoxin:NAD+ oxidoreductase subunit A
MLESLALIVATVLVNNIVLVKVLGLCPFMGVSRQMDSALGMGAATAFVLTLSSGFGYLIDQWVLEPYELEYLRTLSYIVVIASVVGITDLYVAATSPVLHHRLGIYLPLITTNCAVLGVPLLNSAEHRDFLASVLFGLGNAAGFTLVLVIFAGLRERLEGLDVPAPFRGAAIGMVTAGLMSLAFMGFAGLVKT